MTYRRPSLLAAVGPGLLVAATGVGAGDLATASIAGAKLGLTVLWAVLVGAFVKFVLTEGLARWQLATGCTLLEGVVRHLGKPAAWFFLVYLVVWSIAVGRALASACGITAHALIPAFDDPVVGKMVFGAIHSLVGVVLVWLGGYRLFERTMSMAIGLMFVSVVLTAVALKPDLVAMARGLLPRVPAATDGLTWTVALLGGVGGTVTLLCYGYWIREEGRETAADLSLCRIDLALGYLATAVFGVAMVIVGSTVEVEGGGATLLVSLADRLELSIGGGFRWLFLMGAWGAVMSSLLGVWQSIPYLFSDLWSMLQPPGQPRAATDLSETPAYRVFLTGLGSVSVIGLLSSFVEIQKIYAVVGALFIPMLAATLLLLNGRAIRIGERFRNRLGSSLVLIASVVMFIFFGGLQLGVFQ